MIGAMEHKGMQHVSLKAAIVLMVVRLKNQIGNQRRRTTRCPLLNVSLERRRHRNYTVRRAHDNERAQVTKYLMSPMRVARFKWLAG
jgi:hypothetical protein